MDSTSIAKHARRLLDESHQWPCRELDEYARCVREVDDVVGVLRLEGQSAKDVGIAIFLPGVDASDDVMVKLEARRDAREAKDFASADAIRDELAAMGYAIKDVAGGKVEVSRA